MSKAKYLASAQKNLEKGQIAKAVKDYQKIVEADPRDVRHRQKLAELHSRARQFDEAMTEYGKVARHYADNGFYLKAIAVYKQMQKLDPARPELYLHLAELNRKQGLAGNAAAEYRSLTAFYEERKMYPEAATALEKLQELEPENLNVRVKIVETHLRGGLQERARKGLTEVLDLLREKGDFARALRLYELFLPLHPKNPELKMGYGEALLYHGDLDRGLQVLSQLAGEDPQDLRVLLALAEGYRRKGDAANERQTIQGGLRLFPDNLDLQAALIRSLLDAGEFPRATDELERCLDLFRQSGKEQVLQELFRSLREALPGDPRVQRLAAFKLEREDAEITLAEGDFGAMAIPPVSPEAAKRAGEPLVAEAGSGLPEGEEETAAFDSAEGEELSLADLSLAEEPPPTGLPGSAAASPGTSGFPEEDLELELELEVDFEEDLPTLSLAAVGEDEPEEDLLELTEVPEDTEVELTLQRRLDKDRFFPEQEFREDFGDDEILDLSLDLQEEEEPEGGSPAMVGESFIDLAGELLSEEDSGEETEEVVPATVEAGAGPAAKSGIRTEAVQLEDAESHFQLGIAYKEMGLIDEAVKEFEQAMKDPARGVACLILKGICLAEQGRMEGAETAFKAGLGHALLAEGEKIGLHFELGCLYENWGRLLDALDSFQYVADQDLFFREVGERIIDLRRRLGLDGDPAKEDPEAKGSRKRVSYI